MQIGVPVLKQPIATETNSPAQNSAMVRPMLATVVTTENRNIGIQKRKTSDVEMGTIQLNIGATIQSMLHNRSRCSISVMVIPFVNPRAHNCAREICSVEPHLPTRNFWRCETARRWSRCHMTDK
jgi:hypothetical protein